MNAGTIRNALGMMNSHEAFRSMWLEHGFPEITDRDFKGSLTPTIQSFFTKKNPPVPGFLHKRLKAALSGGPIRKDVNAALIKDNIPILFDPEVLDIFIQETPLVLRVPHQGFDGFTVVSNTISARDAPIGYVAEATAGDLSGQAGKDFTPGKNSTDHKIYVDVTDVSDFSQRAGEFYIDLRDTTLGTRIAEHAHYKEQCILYGDPSQAKSDGSPGDSNAFEGLIKTVDPANIIDKSAVDISGTQALLKDIKAEIKSLLQAGYGLRASDLEVWVSHTLHDYLENEMQVSARIDVGENSFNFGYESIRIKGIPVIASHNIKQHSWSGYTPGNEGDVFIYNKRSTRFYNLAPLSTLPLARVGLADRLALYEYGTLHERAEGLWGKYLKAYAI